MRITIGKDWQQWRKRQPECPMCEVYRAEIRELTAENERLRDEVASRKAYIERVTPPL